MTQIVFHDVIMDAIATSTCVTLDNPRLYKTIELMWKMLEIMKLGAGYMHAEVRSVCTKCVQSVVHACSAANPSLLQLRFSTHGYPR